MGKYVLKGPRFLSVVLFGSTYPPPRSCQLQSAVIVGVGVGLELNKTTKQSMGEEVVHHESFTGDFVIRALPNSSYFLFFITYHVLHVLKKITGC